MPVTDTRAALNPRYTFENLVVGACNEWACAAAGRVVEGPGRGYNPLLLYGGSGVGKTHLLHAIGHAITAGSPGLTIRLASFELYIEAFTRALVANDVFAFQNAYHGDVLLIDDADALGTMPLLRAELSNAFAGLVRTRKQVVLASGRSHRAAALAGWIPDCFEQGRAVQLLHPDLATRRAMVSQMAAAAPADFPADALDLLASHVTENVRALEGAVVRLGAYAGVNREAVTIELAQTVLTDTT